jgi:hypothetical protein
MKTLGIRAAPKAVVFAVFDAEQQTVVNVEEMKVPAAFAVPDALKYVRSNLLDIIREYDVRRAGIRTTESSAKTLSIERIEIEGVIQEAFASSALESYYVGEIASICRRVGVDRSRFKPMVAGENDLAIESWQDLSDKQREAVLCAIGASNA